MANTAARPVTSEQELRERVEAYLADPALGGPEISETISRVRPLGGVAIFGGMLRDLARGGAGAFRSDVDLVVDCEAEELDRFVRDMPVERNKFGGYRFVGRRFVYDLWALPNTWAVRQGHVAAHALADLTKTTFFDCDAVVYDAGTRAIHWSDRYLEKLQAETVEINLEDNPNRVGVLARTLRILFDWRQSLGPQLAWYLHQGLGELADEVCRYGAASRPESQIRSLPVARLIERIREHEVYRPFCIGDLAHNPAVGGPASATPLKRRSPTQSIRRVSCVMKKCRNDRSTQTR
ncbi:hypothetical protein [Microvirga thermotolerans]|uniref:Poly A polymerase head domain-containing protein n=1 Tax=Microvirga thermotolerans TaxID=2651334 RepID=A0A5P9K3R8_9HYPH|nr:hypothetical protein [Microvirga thermotolerans]QFU16924.1 hypothetical protein GDR74_12210 [Microvirga thermotolerans]